MRRLGRQIACRWRWMGWKRDRRERRRRWEKSATWKGKRRRSNQLFRPTTAQRGLVSSHSFSSFFMIGMESTRLGERHPLPVLFFRLQPNLIRRKPLCTHGRVHVFGVSGGGKRGGSRKWCFRKRRTRKQRCMQCRGRRPTTGETMLWISFVRSSAWWKFGQRRRWWRKRWGNPLPCFGRL